MNELPPINKDKIVLLKQMIENAEKNIRAAKSLLAQILPKESHPTTPKTRVLNDEINEEGASIVEGSFDGENMIGADGKQYPVPANYASKSKLIEGDTLKLTILPDGTFVYKQIGPSEREKVLGTLMQNDAGDYYVLAEGKSYRVLLASVTYYKGAVGDEVTLIVPKGKDSEWGAIENIIKDLTNLATDTGTSVADITKENTTDIDKLEDELNVSKELL